MAKTEQQKLAEREQVYADLEKLAAERGYARIVLYTTDKDGFGAITTWGETPEIHEAAETIGNMLAELMGFDGKTIQD